MTSVDLTRQWPNETYAWEDLLLFRPAADRTAPLRVSAADCPSGAGYWALTNLNGYCTLVGGRGAYAAGDRNKRLRGTGGALHRLCALAVPDPSADACRRPVAGHAAKRAGASRRRRGSVLHRPCNAIQPDTPVDAPSRRQLDGFWTGRQMAGA